VTSPQRLRLRSKKSKSLISRNVLGSFGSGAARSTPPDPGFVRYLHPAQPTLPLPTRISRRLGAKPRAKVGVPAARHSILEWSERPGATQGGATAGSPPSGALLRLPART
jgi:hypothetical protein